MAKKKDHLRGSILAFAACLVGGILIGYYFENQAGGAFIGAVVGVIAAAFFYVI